MYITVYPKLYKVKIPFEGWKASEGYELSFQLLS